jgi:hypothetical protein
MMNRSKIFALLTLSVLTLGSCKDELDVKNPNQPTKETLETENGVVNLAQGFYVNGFRGLDARFNDGVPGFFWSGAIGIHEIMGDVIGCEAANWYLNQVGCPNQAVLDNGTTINNPQSPNQQINLLRAVNDVAQQGGNPTFHEWANMYNLNNACNTMLAYVDIAPMPINGDVKKKTLKAWAYWWKGFAYSRIGSIYYAGLINNEAGKASNVYVTKEALIAESNSNFDKAAALLNGLTGAGYAETLGKLIPSFCQTGKGSPPSTAEWTRSINTMKARNIIVNKTIVAMTAADWANVLALTNNGVQETDNVFTGRSNPTGDIWAGATGFVATKVASSDPGDNTYKLSERFVQEFKAGDKRKDNNVAIGTEWIGNADRGISFNTRFALLSGGAGLAGVYVYGDQTPGAGEFYLASTFEENELMKAEALLRGATPNVAAAVTAIDAVRTSQGAGLAPLASNISVATAIEELRRERRVALAFRGLSFYDGRRWGVATGSRAGCVLVDGNAVVNTNATIKYNFLDYWDVPDNELKLNPAGAGSAPTKNPK